MSFQTVLRAVQLYLRNNSINLHKILWSEEYIIQRVNASFLNYITEYNEEAEMMEMLQDLLH